jgi:hypothetical protein
MGEAPELEPERECAARGKAGEASDTLAWPRYGECEEARSTHARRNEAQSSSRGAAGSARGAEEVAAAMIPVAALSTPA